MRRPRSSSRAGHGLGGWLALAVLAAAATLLVLGTTAGRVQGAATQATGSDVASGRQLFLQSCAACHGTQGQGTANGPSIADLGAAAVDFVLRTGRMPLSAPNAQMQRDPPVFSDPQIRSLDAFAATLGHGPAIPTVDVTRGDLARGQSLFIQNCAACHAATGAGDAVGGGFVAPNLSQADPLTVAEAMRVGPGAMPPFDPRTFPQQDVNDIAAYVQFLRRPGAPGGLSIAGVGPVSEGFVALVVILGLLFLVVRWIGRPARPSRGTAGPPGESR